MPAHLPCLLDMTTCCFGQGGVVGQGSGPAAASMEQVAAAIKQRKAQLAPAIQELRNLRNQQQVRLAGPACFGGRGGCIWYDNLALFNP